MLDSRWWIGVGLIVMLATGLRLYRLGHQNLWIDEIVQARIAAQSPADILRNYSPYTDPAARDQAPLSFLILHPFLSRQHPEWSARLPSALFGVMDVLAVYFVACEFLPGGLPLLAALLLAISPLHVWYSQEARWYTQWGLLTTLSYLAFMRAWRHGSTVAWVSYALLTLCGIYTFIFSFFVMLSQGLSAWWLSRLPPRAPNFLRTFIGIQIGIVVACGPVLWVVLNQLGLSTGTPRPTPLSALPYTAYAFAVGFTFGPTLAYLHRIPELVRLANDYPVSVAVLATCVPLLVIGGRAMLRSPAAAAVVLPWCCGLPLMVFLLAQQTHVTYQTRYSFVALPAFMFLLTAGGAEVRKRWWGWALIAPVLVCMLVSLANHYWNSRYAKEDVRGALNRVRAARVDGAEIIPVGEIDVALRRYADGLAFRRPGSCATAIQPLPALWILAGRDWTGEAAECLTRLGEQYRIAEHQTFTGVELWLLRRRDD